jgi:site-specific recombinase XerD
MAQSFRRHLRAEGKAPKTLATYLEAVRQLQGARAHVGVLDVSSIEKEHIEDFIGDLRETRSPATANNRFRSLQQFFNWLYQEGHIPSSPMGGMKPPA